jgi:hypothetical protein
MERYFSSLLLFAVALASLACQKEEDGKPATPSGPSLAEQVIQKFAELDYGSRQLAPKNFSKISVNDSNGLLTERNVTDLKNVPNGKFIKETILGEISQIASTYETPLVGLRWEGGFVNGNFLIQLNKIEDGTIQRNKVSQIILSN